MILPAVAPINVISIKQDLHINGPVIIETGEAPNFTIITSQYNSAFLTGEVHEVFEWLETLDIRPHEREQEPFLEQQPQKRTTLDGLNKSMLRCLPKMETILNSVCLIRWTEVEEGEIVPYTGTGFLASIPDMGIAFISAGHNFISKWLNNDLNTNFGVTNHVLYFGNLKGVNNPNGWNANPRHGTIVNMSSFLKQFNARGSISYNGRKILVQGGEVIKYETAQLDEERSEDYCALLLDHEHVKNELLQIGLDYLQCGQHDYLDCEQGGIVVLFGHPADGAEEENGHRPLRMSFGVESDPDHVKKNFQGKETYADNFLFYDNDTLAGHSGSPVIGRGNVSSNQAYCVKGIHVSASELEKTNQAQKLKNLTKWINSRK